MKDSNDDCSWFAELPKLVMTQTRAERSDAMKHRQRILEVAQRLFSEQGVDTVSMHQIAVAAGIGQGTLYRRYANKGQLCVDLLRERHVQFEEKITALFAATESMPVLKRLDEVLMCCVEFVEEEGALLGPMATTHQHEWRCKGTNDLQHVNPQGVWVFSWLHQIFAGLLTDAVKQREIEELDVSYTADAILNALHPMIYRFQRQERGFSSERILKGLQHIYIDGLKTIQHKKDLR